MKLTLSILTILLSAFIAFGQTDLDKGIELYQSNDYNAAISVLQGVVNADQNDRDAWLFLGMSLAQAKKTKEAIKALRKGDSISGKFSTVYDKAPKIISKPRAQFTDAARQNMTRGVVKLAVEFGADKKIKSIVTIQSLPDGLTQICIAAAKGIKFEPASKNGNPVSSIKIVEYAFDIF
jgi:tetratricopeptide (TPR) repeat protein